DVCSSDLARHHTKCPRRTIGEIEAVYRQYAQIAQPAAPCKADDQRRGTVRCTWQDFIAAQRSPAAGSGSKKGSGREVECQGPRSLREIPVRTFCEEKEEGAGQAGFHQSV